MNKTILYILISVFAIAVIAGIYLIAKKPYQDVGSGISNYRPTNSDHIKGNKEAELVLIEYSDFQCPACGAYYPILKELSREFGDKIVFVYRHFPLTQIHKNAKLAAIVSEAAGKQDKFWEIHDVIFENQKEWSDSESAIDYFIKYAQRFNLDIEKFKFDINSEELKQKVESDYLSGLELKVNATPTFILNGKKIQNPRSYEEFKKVAESYLNSANESKY